MKQSSLPEWVNLLEIGFTGLNPIVFVSFKHFHSCHILMTELQWCSIKHFGPFAFILKTNHCAFHLGPMLGNFFHPLRIFVISQSVCETRLEKLARDKHSSLLRKLVDNGQKKFYNFEPWAQCYETFCNVNLKGQEPTQELSN